MVHSPDSRFPRPPEAPATPSQAEPGALHPTVVDIDSSTPLPELPMGPGPTCCTFDHPAAGWPVRESSGSPQGERMFWLNGDVLICACPDCRAPMTVRLWLMLADCWQCETCIELTEEQEREARRVLERDRVVQRHSAHALLAPSVGTAQASEPARARAAVSTGPDESRLAPRRPTMPAARQPHIVHEPMAPPRRLRMPSGRARRQAPYAGVHWLHAFFKNMPAWLISLLFHVVLLTILGLLTEPAEDGPYITLSTRVHAPVREGGYTQVVSPTDKAVFDLGVPDSVDVEDPAERRALARADQDARELRLVDPDNPHLPDLTKIRQQLASASALPLTLAARDPRLRVEMVQQEGGTTLTEAAVARGLRWLARHQNPNGSWSLDRFHRVEGCDCGDRGSLDSDTAATALALLPFLGAGQTHLSGLYRDNVAQGLRWLLATQGSDGDLRGSPGQYPGMYAQGQAAIVLSEAFFMTGDEALRVPAQQAVDFIVASQYLDGGWRYYPRGQTQNMRGDTSVVAWQLMALQSALAAGLSVPPATLENASHFLDTVQHQEGATYGYLPRENPSAPMTAAGQLCRIYLGWKRSHPALTAGIDQLLEQEPPSLERPNIYYWYYATQTLHHYGGHPWKAWNLKMRDVLVESQQTHGHAAGSWTPAGPLTSHGGRLYMTSLAVCCLEVYYRHLPIFRQLELD
ncbi:MAG: prenyltransferase/squalene oxidase repeat-containing protein [Pirellulaceae bacterium]